MMGKGARLEQQIAAYFRLNDYDADTNVKLEGKSGAVHEIDVLAKKSDGITAFSVAVECKAWITPIEKDVVSKLSMVIGDLGLNKGIIVSLQGWRSGAEKSAHQELIELWGPDELGQRLGSVTLAELNARETNQYTILGVQGTHVSDQDLELALDRQSRGILGMGREEQVWTGLTWVPFHLIELHYATMVKEFLRKPAIKVTPVWSLYSAVDDHYFTTREEEPLYTTLEVSHVVPAKTKPKPLVNELVATVKKAHEVTTTNALARYQEKLTTLGLPQNLENLSTEKVIVVHYPFYLGLFRRRGNERLVAIDAFSGAFDQVASASLTGALAYISRAVGMR